MTKRGPSDWQRQVLAELAAIADAFPGEAEVLGGYRVDSNQRLSFRLRVRTADLARAAGGLPVGDDEEFLITVGTSNLIPPIADVDHLRFLHHAHVLQGQRLCLYLDPGREWDPVNGFGGFLDRLTEWLADAAAGRFDAQTALYHAVGGVLHTTRDAPTVVVRSSLTQGRRAQHGWLVRRASHRLDLTLNRPARATGITHVPIVTLDADLPFGAGTNLASLLVLADNPHLGQPAPSLGTPIPPVLHQNSDVLLTVLGASAIRKPDGTTQAIVIAVPHPAGGPPHLLAANIPAPGADHIRDLVRSHRRRSSMIDIDRADVDPNTPLEWWPVSDERAEVTTRRDSARPVAAFAGKTIHIWGCGGLGSWVAEYVVRAGATKVDLCDPGRLTGGLLVRQNYVEADVGKAKVHALAQRLNAISDSVEVSAHDAITPAIADLGDVDLMIDTTVSIAISRLLDDVAATADRPVLAQMATDVRTGTLGMMTVSMPPLLDGPMTLDRQAGRRVISDGTLEPFHDLWSGSESDEITPTRGCSTPTFHGSAADLAAVAASLTSILGSHLASTTPVSGTHLISLPHGEAGPLRRFLPAQDGANTPGGADEGAAQVVDSLVSKPKRG